MTVTLADVARRARVSPATVSRVLSGNHPVAAATRERVLGAVRELDYVVNGPASALAAASSDLVGILVNDIADPFFGIMAGAVQTELATASRLGVVCNTGGSPERELTYLTLLRRQRAGAVVLCGGTAEDPGHTAAVAANLARLTADGTRVVLCGRPPVYGEPVGAVAAVGLAGAGGSTGAAGRGGNAGNAGDAGNAAAASGMASGGGGPVALAFDNLGGARALTAHLLELGHRRIGYAAGPLGRTTTRDRLAGHLAALRAAGADGSLVVHGSYDRQSGYDAAVELLRRDPGATAIVGANDTVALGVCAALRDRGLRVPDDVSVAGFDDLPFSQDTVPSLTTIRLPLSATAAWAGRLALAATAPPPGGVATVRGELVVRGSTGRCAR